MKGYLKDCRLLEDGTLQVTVQGCTLRCAYCPCPDIWDKKNAPLMLTPDEVLANCAGVKQVTLTGGEPLEQAEFAAQLFALCRVKGITTHLDTPGSRNTPEAEALLAVTDKVTLHIQMTTEESYRRYTGSSLVWITGFLKQLQKHSIPTRLLQTLVPYMNDTPENARAMKELAEDHSCIQSWDYVPFTKGGAEIYEKLGIPYAAANYPDCTEADVARMKKF